MLILRIVNHILIDIYNARLIKSNIKGRNIVTEMNPVFGHQIMEVHFYYGKTYKRTENRII